MLECLVLGDSIAVGTSWYKPHCEVHAKVGINSRDWNRRWLTHTMSANKVIISLGSNDWNPNITREEIEKLRGSIKANRVIWLIPAIKPTIRQVVKDVAAKHGDGMIDLVNIPRGPDHVHPTRVGYHMIANRT